MSGADYGRQYDDYWSREDRRGESSGDLDRVAREIVATCGPGSVLDVGSGEGRLVETLVRNGVDARGLDVSAVVVARCNARLAGRFDAGSVLALPYGNGAFDTVVSTDCMEHLEPKDVPAAIAEMARVSRGNVYLVIATTQDRDAHWHLTVEGRAWWEERCFAAGLRKHPAYYRVNPYEALNRDGWQVTIVLEKIPAAAARDYSLDWLHAERDLHNDMLGVAGERSDAHVARYDWAAGYLKPNDRVLDAACGLGYGAHLLARLVRGARVLGIDGSAPAVAYASACYGSDRVSFREGFLPQALADLPPASFDAIVSFETLEHVADPQALLAAFHRLLVPGGRLVVSVPHDWSDETGRDPNPFHLQVYDWARLVAEVAPGFLVEHRFAQTASRAKVAAAGGQWQPRGRELRRIDDPGANPDSEWCLLTAMKSPLDESVPYEERVFANVAGTAPVSMAGYRYPWLAHALINFTHRLRDPRALESLADEVLARCGGESLDGAAALCVKAYRVLDRATDDPDSADDMVKRIDALAAEGPQRGAALRWQVSLAFVKAKLQQALGRMQEARRSFEACGRPDVRAFDIHLATKTTEAWFQAGRLALAEGDREGAREAWRRGVAQGDVLLSSTRAEILLDEDQPNLFNHGDGVREYALAWDSIARCANGLHLLHAPGPLDVPALEASFQREYAIVSDDVRHALAVLAQTSEQAHALEALLKLRTDRLDAVTRDLEKALADLDERTADLVQVRADLAERTRALDVAHADLDERTADLVAIRADLKDRTVRLEEAVAHPWRHAYRITRGKS